MKKSLIIVMCVIILLSLVNCNNNDDTSLQCIHCGETIADDAKFCPHCGGTVLNSSDDDNNGEQCSHSWKTAMCTEAKTCSKCGETEGNALGHTTTTGVCDRCNVRQGWSENEVQSLIKVYDVFVSDIDSADGVDMQIAWENTSSKTIKYIYFTVEAYNAVDDKVACEVRDSYQFIGELTGPFTSGYTNLIYDAQEDSYSVNTVFENCYYNANIRYFEITNIRIVYMDNTEFELDEDSVNYAFAETPQGLYYTWNDEYNGYEVNYRLKDKCTATEITVPSTYNNSNVVAIANGAFKSITSTESISLPDTVKHINSGAFRGCSNLKSIIIPDGVTEIGDIAFCECISLTDIIIPDSVTSMGAFAFDGCRSLKNIVFPKSLTSIGDYAFSNCYSLESVTNLSSVTSIGYGAFSGCRSLTNVELSEGVVEIEERTFYGCSMLKHVVIPKSVTKIGAHAFDACSALSSINYKGTTQQWSDIYKAVFWDGYGYSADYTIICSNGIINPDGTIVEKDDGQNISINYTLSEDGSYYIIFATEFLSEENLVIPSEYKGKPVKEIGEAAFEYNTSLKSISISSSIVKIGNSAFYFCKNLESINIPEGVISIGV